MLPNLSLLLLLPAASALNNIFNPTPYQECNACVDAAANSCPGDYETKAYATCLCAGAGSAGIAGCLSTCDAVDTQPMGAADKVAGNFFSYCIMFFPDLCAEAEYYVRKDWWAEKCGPGAVKGAGFGRESTSGDPSGNSGSGGESGGGSGGGGSGGASGSGASATGGLTEHRQLVSARGGEEKNAVVQWILVS
ncbi:hypothetical protein QBC39DRAFT_331249 [Podospora conica]|nr:hypothetical protein QBC39DRAFT_331249 [Schizothecium conicum]